MIGLLPEPEHGSGTTRLVQRLINKGKEVIEKQPEYVTDIKRDISTRLKRADNFLKTKHDSLLDASEAANKTFTLFYQAQRINEVNETDLCRRDFDAIRTSLEDITKEIRTDLMNLVETKAEDKELTGIQAIRYFESIFSITQTHNQITTKKHYDLPRTYSKLMGDQEESPLNQAFGNLASDFIELKTKLIKDTPENIKKLSGLDLNESTLKYNARIEETIMDISKEKLREVLMAPRLSTNSTFKPIQQTDFEKIYEILKDEIGIEHLEKFAAFNRTMLIGAYCLNRQQADNQNSSLENCLDNLTNADLGNIQKTGIDATAKDIKNAEKYFIEKHRININKQFVYSPITPELIPCIKATDGKNEGKNSSVRTKISRYLKDCLTNEEERNGKLIQNFDANVDKIYEAVITYRESLRVVDEFKNFALMMLPRIDLEQYVKTLEQKDNKNYRHNVFTNELLKESDKIFGKKLIIRTDDIPLKETVSVKFAQRYLKEQKEKARNLMGLYSELFNNNGVVGVLEEKIGTEIAQINQKYDNSLLDKISIEGTNHKSLMNYCETILEKKIKETEELYEDANSLGRQSAVMLTNLKSIELKFNQKATYRKNTESKLEELTTKTISNINELIEQYNSQIESERKEELSILKSSYSKIVDVNERKINLDFVGLLLNLKTTLEKMQHVADKQEQESDKLRSYETINDLQRDIGRYISSKYKSNYDRTTSIAEREFLRFTKFYFEKVIGQEIVNGTGHEKNKIYGILHDRLAVLEGEDFPLLNHLKDLEKLENVRAGHYLLDQEKEKIPDQEKILTLYETISRVFSAEEKTIEARQQNQTNPEPLPMGTFTPTDFLS
ncbi:MAG: hypothetical protein Q8O89_06655 [Nanoarchaeota archaeon]|nr:hypothetical protein [Nanoarchaeota archaeon]